MADISSSSPSTTGQPFLHGTDTWTRLRNFSRMAFGTMSEAGQKQYWKDADTRYEKIDIARVEANRDYLLQYSPIIRFMQENITRLGGTLDKSNIRCRKCEVPKEGGFDKDFGIVLCANYLDSQSKVEDVMAHEMVHCYDHLRFNTDLDGAKDLRHVACSEIRASNLSGECRWANEFFGKRQFKFNRHQQDCVRNRAILSVRSRPECKDDVQAVKVVNEVWDSCFRDTRPFDEVFR